MVEKLLSGIDVRLGISYKDFKEEAEKEGIFATDILYTGAVDEYYDYSLGKLSYRSLRFETEYLEDTDNYQGNAVVNYTEATVPYTRIIEHRHFEKNDTAKGTVITREYPAEWKEGSEPYYPMSDEKNLSLYARYMDLATKEPHTYFGGRMGLYRYLDMDKIIREALNFSKEKQV